MPENSKVKNIVRAAIIMAMSLLVCCEVGIQELFQKDKISIIPEFSITSEAIKKENYIGISGRVTLIRNLSPIEKLSSASNNIIVMKPKYNISILQEKLVNFVYRVSEDCSSGQQRNKKGSIFVIPLEINNRETYITKLKEMKAIKPIEDEAEKFKSALQFLEEYVSICIYNKYIYHMDSFRGCVTGRVDSFYRSLKDCISICTSSLRYILEDTFAYKLIEKVLLFQKRCNYENLFILFSSCERKIDDAFEKSSVLDIKVIDEADMVFEDDTRRIDEQIRYSEAIYSEIHDLQGLVNEIVNFAIMLINILTNGKFPLLIEDALCKEKEIKNGEEKTKVRIKEDLKSKLREEVKKWNFRLLELLCEKIETVWNFSGTIEELRKTNKESDDYILDELENRRKEEYTKWKIPSLLVEKFIRKIKPIRKLLELLEIVYKSILEDKDDKFRKTEMARKEEESIRSDIISALASCISSSSKEKSIEYVKNMIVFIAEKYTGFGALDQDIIKEKKKELTDSIIDVLDEDIDGKSDVLIVKSEIKDVLNEIIDILLTKEIEEDACRKYNSVKEEIEKNNRAFKSRSWDAHISFIIEYLNNYYELIFGNLPLYLQNILKLRENEVEEESTSETTKEATKNQIIDKRIEHAAQKEDLKDLDELLKNMKTIYEYISMINSYSEIWMDPIYLTIDLLKNITSSRILKVRIRYMEKESRRIVTKNIAPTDENIEAFRSARTLQDIRNI